jgi:hypothetical protein
MSAERTEEFAQPRTSGNLPVSVSVTVAEDGQQRSQDHIDTTRNAAGSGDGKPGEPANVKHEAAPTKEPGSAGGGGKVSITKVGMQSRVPPLDDDAQIGGQKEHNLTRDGKADLLFTGALLASAAPTSAPKGQWQEYRIYRTNGDKHVFSKVTRNVLENEEDTYEAEVFDPAPASVPSQLMRSAREIARNRPLTWMDGAVSFFGYDPLAKALYRKLSVRFEEQIS